MQLIENNAPLQTITSADRAGTQEVALLAGVVVAAAGTTHALSPIPKNTDLVLEEKSLDEEFEFEKEELAKI